VVQAGAWRSVFLCLVVEGHGGFVRGLMPAALVLEDVHVEEARKIVLHSLLDSSVLVAE